MIKSFKCRETEKIFNLERSRYFPTEIQVSALRKLKMIHHSQSLVDLLVPPANRLEKLWGDRKGKWSIRINRQWRICFEWHGSGAFNVEIVDCH